MKVDWLTWTMPYKWLTDDALRYDVDSANSEALANLCDVIPEYAVISQDWNFSVPQRPYTQAFVCAVTGIKMHVAKYRRECLFTADGTACGRLHDAGLIGAFVHVASETCTRIDIAIDTKTEVRPNEIAKHGYSKRIKTYSEVVKQSGETCYIGSRTSDVMCRVYRYNKPHPRHKLLRFEFEIKGDTAKAVSQQIVVDGIHKVARGIGQRFEFSHPIAVAALSGSAVTVRTEPHKKSAAKTELWLIKTAVPAFHRLVSEGVIDDPKAWIEKYMNKSILG